LVAVVESFSLLPTLTTSQRLIYLFFSMEFLEQNPLYVNKIWKKFQGQPIITKKDINNLPTCVVVGNNGEKCYQRW
jgi:hypothetical protein